MKTKFLLIALLGVIFSFAQEQIKLIKRGTLTLTNNEKIEFSNLIYENDKVTYTNLQNQSKEHLYLTSILSIDEGQVEMISSKDLGKVTKETPLEDGVYYTLESLAKKQFKSGELSLKVKNASRDLYYFQDANGNNINNGLVIVKDGNVYIRGKGIKKYLKENKGLSFNRNGRTFVRLRKEGDLYTGEAPFSNVAIAIPGAIISGVGAGVLIPGIGGAILVAAGGSSLFSLAAATKKDIVLDLNNQEIYLR